MSGNGRYLFVGAPGENKIYSYTLVTIPTSSAKVFTITITGSRIREHIWIFTPN